MAIAAARELALCAEERGIDEENIVPTMDEWEVFPREAVAVALMAQQQGVARLQLSREELLSKARATICQAREMVQFLMDKEIIPPVPEKWR
ncbi:MAG TPA: malate dehydrogenase, partial [Anaerolineae bacterium]|nr:malate dehydrogenase [Anaerolineae bacterium]